MRQRDVFLEVLRERGSRGIHTFELRGMYIGNPSQRKAELEAEGFVLKVGPKERLHGQAWGKRYTLLSEPAPEQTTSATSPVSSPSADKSPMPALTETTSRSASSAELLFDLPSTPHWKEAA